PEALPRAPLLHAPAPRALPRQRRARPEGLRRCRAAEQREELASSEVEHGLLSPEPDVPAYSRPRMLRKRPQVLGVDLNRSESSGALPCCAATNDSTHEPAAPQDFSPVFVGFGSRADITRSPSNVR